MEGYLGEFPVEISESKFANYTPADWAMYYVSSYGQIHGSHHKDWVLDQVARILKGTPITVVEARWAPNERYHDGLSEYRVSTGEPSQAYLDWVEWMRGDTDEDGEREYSYDAGVAP